MPKFVTFQNNAQVWLRNKINNLQKSCKAADQIHVPNPVKKHMVSMSIISTEKGFLSIYMSITYLQFTSHKIQTKNKTKKQNYTIAR